MAYVQLCQSKQAAVPRVVCLVEDNRKSCAPHHWTPCSGKLAVHERSCVGTSLGIHPISVSPRQSTRLSPSSTVVCLEPESKIFRICPRGLILNGSTLLSSSRNLAVPVQAGVR